MAADTFTSTLGTLVMQTGNDNNTWGGNANSFVFQILEDSIANVLTSAVTGGTLDLSGSPPPAAASQVRYYSLKFTGVLTSNQTVIVPNLTKMWLVENLTTGSFSLFIKTTSGTATQIPQGTMKYVRCDGANGVKRADFNEIGRAEDFFLTTAPSGYMECDGSLISRANFPDLFNLFNSQGLIWGSGDGFTTFALPNLKDTGRFKRSRTGLVSVGTYQSNQNLSHTHTGTTDATSIAHSHAVNITTSTMNQSDPHTHTYTAPGGGFLVQAGGGSLAASPGSLATSGSTSINHTHNVVGNTAGMSANDPHTHTFTSASSGGTEARPESVVVLSCIRY